MISRRRFLHTAAAASAAALVTPQAFADIKRDRVLRLHNLHTGESVTATYWAEGAYVPDELAAMDYFMRDFRTGTEKHIDHRLYDLLCALQLKLERKGTFELISGYRSPATNAMLRRTTSGVAKHSLHIQGKAADIRLRGVQLIHLRRAALALRAGGVGYYPHSDFVHVDTGRPRQWRGA